MKCDYKIGVITLPGRYNYGNRLQNLAVCQIYSSMGCYPVSLYLGNRFNCIRAIKSIARKLLRVQIEDPEKLMTKDRIDAFNNFNQLIPSLQINSLNSEVLADFDYYSVGSDQVWNPNLVPYDLDWYLLEFAEPSKRIALAPSIAIEYLNKKQRLMFKKNLSNYPHLSVREARGAELIRDCTGVNAKVICDPTLVLPANTWRTFANGTCTPSGPFVFTYLLGGIGPEASDVLEKVTNHGRIPVVSLSDRQKSGEPDAGPAEFIDLIDNAKHVVTDSFHAAVFSSILHTPLTIVHREGGANMFSRLEQLSQMLGIEEKVHGSPSFDLEKAGDYKGVDDAIGRERDKFMSYLEDCLNG